MTIRSQLDKKMNILSQAKGYPEVKQEYERLVSLATEPLSEEDRLLIAILVFCEVTGDVDVECAMRG